MTPTKIFPTLWKTDHRMLKPAHLRNFEHCPLFNYRGVKTTSSTLCSFNILVLFSVFSDIWRTSAKPVHFPVPKQEALNKTSTVQMTELPTSLLMWCLGTTQPPGLWSIQSCSLFPMIHQIIPNISATLSLVIWPAAKTQEDARSKPCDWRKILFSLWVAFSLQLHFFKKKVLQTISFLSSNLRKTHVPQL